jgi:hypothetical protein
MARSTFLLVALLLGTIFSITAVTAAYAQDGGMAQTTSKDTLDIRLAPTWNEGGQATFSVSFLNPGTDTLHEHQDYDFRILKKMEITRYRYTWLVPEYLPYLLMKKPHFL